MKGLVKTRILFINYFTCHILYTAVIKLKYAHIFKWQRQSGIEVNIETSENLTIALLQCFCATPDLEKMIQ